MNTPTLHTDIFCIYCKNEVHLSNREYKDHMRLVHDISSHMDLIVSLNFIKNTDKANTVLKIQQIIKQTARKSYFTCLFCKNSEKQVPYFLLQTYPV